jgi:hypothetical protein
VIEMIQLMSISKTLSISAGHNVAVAFSFLEYHTAEGDTKDDAQKTTAAVDSAKAPVMLW